MSNVPVSNGDKSLLQYVIHQGELEQSFCKERGIAPRASMALDLLAKGEFWTPGDVPKRYAAYVRFAKPHNCYEDAAKLAFANDELEYAEGYAISIIPIQHAWCVDASGNVVDVSWAASDRRFKRKYKRPTDRSNIAYFGVKIAKDELRKQVLKRMVWGYY